jgi:hypothetical protein
MDCTGGHGAHATAATRDCGACHRVCLVEVNFEQNLRFDYLGYVDSNFRLSSQ